MLTSYDLHQAFCSADPDNACSWDDIPEAIKMKYVNMAHELNLVIDSQQPSIDAIRCKKCNEMVPASLCRWHPCFLGEKK